MSLPPAIEWVVRECVDCGQEFHNRKRGEDGVYPERCPECCEKLGHKTAVKWADWKSELDRNKAYNWAFETYRQLKCGEEMDDKTTTWEKEQLREHRRKNPVPETCGCDISEGGEFWKCFHCRVSFCDKCAPEHFGVSETSTACQEIVDELRAARGCLLAGTGRGDCWHAVGLPGISIPNQHDGTDDTVDHTGRPNGWCQICWLSYRVERAEAQLTAMRIFYPEAPSPYDLQNFMNQYNK